MEAIMLVINKRRAKLKKLWEFYLMYLKWCKELDGVAEKYK